MSRRNRRQDALYEDLADFYEPLPTAQVTDSKRMQDTLYSAEPVATNVKGMFPSKVENAHGGSPLGRSDVDNLFTLDGFRIRADAKRDDGTPLIVGDAWIVRLKTAKNPDRLGWWVTQGGSKIRASKKRRAINTQTMLMKRTLKHPGIT